MKCCEVLSRMNDAEMQTSKILEQDRIFPPTHPMKAFFAAIFVLALAPAMRAQDVFAAPAAAAAENSVPLLAREEVEQLVGPIALYPDPLLAVILPASTFPSDIVLAARFVESGEDVALADQKPWDPSVRALTRYPDTLAWMDENLEWTTQLGATYLAQPADVMDAIQAMRTKAQAVGNLTDTPQQRVVREERVIRIVPAQPEYIYVPTYEPEVVYYEEPLYEPLVYFSPAYMIGSWLNFDFDWHRHRLYCGDWHGGWDYDYYDGGHRRHDHRGDAVYINNHITNYTEWSGDSRRRLGSARELAAARVNREGRRSVARPAKFAARGNRAGNEVRRALAADDRRGERDLASTAGRNNDNNNRGDRLNDNQVARAERREDRAERRTKGGLMLPRGDAPKVAGELRGGGKDSRADGKGRGKDDTAMGNRGELGSVDRGDKGRGNKDSIARAQEELQASRNGRRGERDMAPGGSGKASNDAAKSRGDSGRPHIQVPKPNTGKDHKSDRVRDPRSIASASQNAPKARSSPSVRHSSPQKSLAEAKARSAPKSRAVSHSNQKSRGSVSRGGSKAHSVARSSPPRSQARAHSSPKKSQVARSSPSKSHSRAQKAPKAHVARSSPPKSQARPQKAPKSRTVTASHRSAPKAARASSSGGGGGKKAAAGGKGGGGGGKKKKG
jgi:hypothetical protein